MSVRCKFVCSLKDKLLNRLMFAPIYQGSAENEQFFHGTAAGHIEFFDVTQKVMDSFEVGTEYWIDLTPVS